MAEGRFVSRSISTNEQLATVSMEAALLFTWMLPHIDVDGRIAGSPISIKANIVPLRDELTIKRIPKLLAELGKAVDAGGVSLIVWYEVGRQQVLYFPGFAAQQKGMRRDREAPSKLPALSSDVRVLVGQLSASTPGSTPAPTPGAGPAELPDKRSQVEVEVEVQGKGEVEVVSAGAGATTAATTTSGDPNVVLVAAANRAVRERFGEQPSPLRHDAASTHQAVDAITNAGVPIEFARDAIYTRVKSPAIEKPPRSLNYFVEHVKERWRDTQEYASASNSNAKALAGVNGTRRNGESGSFLDLIKPEARHG